MTPKEIAIFCEAKRQEAIESGMVIPELDKHYLNGRKSAFDDVVTFIEKRGEK